MIGEADRTSGLGADEALQLAAAAACATALLSGMLTIAARSRGRAPREIARTLVVLLVLLGTVVACSLGVRSLGWSLTWEVRSVPHVQPGTRPAVGLLLLAGCVVCTGAVLWVIRGLLAPVQEGTAPPDEMPSWPEGDKDEVREDG